MTKAGMNKAGAMTLLMMIAALAGCVGGETDVDFDQALAVSYTHLTLPTIYSV